MKITRGIATLKAASEEREDGLLRYLNTHEFVYVHSSCRQKYINQKYIKAYIKKKKHYISMLSAKEKTSNTFFNWLRLEKQLFLCEKEADKAKEKKRKQIDETKN